ISLWCRGSNRRHASCGLGIGAMRFPNERTDPMKTRLFLFPAAALVAAGMVAVWLYAAPQPHRLDAGQIAAAAGVKATPTDDGVVRIAWARSDVKVNVDGMPLKPFAGLGSWAAFTAAPHGAMVMGDTVVFQDEVNPAMDAAFAHDLEVTGLHNH